MARLPLLGFLLMAGCYAAGAEPPSPSYRNPLDLLDGGGGGVHPSDGGGSRSVGSVDGRMINLSSAIYAVAIDDAGIGRMSLYLADVADLCAAIMSDAGLGANWDVARFHVDGDAPGVYPVAPILPPNGAVAELDYQADSGGFGIVPAASGSLEVDAVDPTGVQPALGSYMLTFSGTDSLTGNFVASPCAAVPPSPGG